MWWLQQGSGIVDRCGDTSLTAHQRGERPDREYATALMQHLRYAMLSGSHVGEPAQRPRNDLTDVRPREAREAVVQAALPSGRGGESGG